MLLSCRSRDIAPQQDRAMQSHVISDATSHAGIHLAFPEAPAAQRQSGSTEAAVTDHQHSTAAPAVYTTASTDSNNTHDKLSKPACSAESSAAVHSKANPATAARTHHVTFSEAQILASPTVKSAAEADEEWTVIQSDGSGSQPTSRAGSATSLVRVKSQVPQALGSDVKQSLPAAAGQGTASVKGMLPVKKKLSVKVPKTGKKCS